MQSQGTLGEGGLAALLEAMQAERATGTLTLSNGGQTCSLYFLFGHLFHASSDTSQGEEVVVEALGWPAWAEFTFDPRAKLPAEETIKSGTAELLAAARARQPAATDLSGSVAAASGEPAASGAASTATLTEAPPPSPSPPAWAIPLAAEEAPRAPAAPTAGRPILSVLGNPDAPPLTDLYPLPAGKPIYEGLKSAFVDFPKLLKTLEADTHTGYVRLDGQDFASVLLLHDGHVLEALYSQDALYQGLEAFQRLRRRMERGEGLLDVIELSGETVVALAQLLTARPLFTGLLGRFVNFDALLEYLAEEKIDGSIVVVGSAETGVILLRKGQVLGAYTQTKRELQSSPAVVGALAAERSARIEVKAGAAPPAGIDVAAALRTPA